MKNMKILIQLKNNRINNFYSRCSQFLVAFNLSRFYNSNVTVASRPKEGNSLPIVPVRTYSEAGTDKFLILEDNRGKVGIYRWVNNKTGKSYIGSSKNLSIRFRQYFNIVYLENETKKNNSNIYRSLIKNGYSKFRLEILEYCELDMLIQREQYYLDLLNPEYNILKKAGSLTGFKHSEATKELMSINKLNSTVSEETRLKIATALSKGNNTIVKNIETKEILSFLSIRKVANYVGIPLSTIAKSINWNRLRLFW